MKRSYHVTVSTVFDAFGCALDGNTKKLCSYASFGLNLNQLHPVTRTTLLHTAILGKHEEAVKLLLDAGANPNQKNEDGETPLVAAVRAGMRSTVWDLLHMGADVNMTDGIGREKESQVTVTSEANVTSGHGVEEGSDVLEDEDEEDDEDQWSEASPLLAAAEMGDEVMVRLLLLASRVDVNQKVGAHQKTALHAAAFAGDLQVLHLLLNDGAEVNAVDADGATPLCYAAMENNVCAMRLLLYKGAKLEGGGAWSPLHAAATRNQLDALALLLRVGHEVNCVDDMGFNPLTCAATAGHAAVVIRLLEAGAKPQKEHAYCWEPTPARIIRSFCRKRRV